MFDRPPRRPAVQTFQFWFGVLLCCGVALAWKLELLPGTARRSTLPVVTDEPMPPPPAGSISPPELPLQAEIPAQLPVIAALAPLPPVVPSTASDVTRHHFAESDLAAEPHHVRTASAEFLAGPPAQSEESPLPATDGTAEKIEATATDAAIALLDLQEVDNLMDRGQDVDAHRLLSTWYWETPAARPQLMSRLNLLARRIYFQPAPHYLPAVPAQQGETLEGVASRYQLTPTYLARLNRLSDGKLPARQSLKILQGPFQGVTEFKSGAFTIHAHGYFVTRLEMTASGSVPTGTFRLARPAAGQQRQSASALVLINPDTSVEIPLFPTGSEVKDGSMPPGLFISPAELGHLNDLLLIGAEVIVRD